MQFIDAFVASGSTCVRSKHEGYYTTVGYIPEDVLYILYSGKVGEGPVEIKQFGQLSVVCKVLEDLGLLEGAWETVNPWP